MRPLSKLFQRLWGIRPQSAPRSRQAFLTVEALERRDLLSPVPLSVPASLVQAGGNTLVAHTLVNTQAVQGVKPAVIADSTAALNLGAQGNLSHVQTNSSTLRQNNTSAANQHQGASGINLSGAVSSNVSSRATAAADFFDSVNSFFGCAANYAGAGAAVGGGIAVVTGGNSDAIGKDSAIGALGGLGVGAILCGIASMTTTTNTNTTTTTDTTTPSTTPETTTPETTTTSTTTSTTTTNTTTPDSTTTSTTTPETTTSTTTPDTPPIPPSTSLPNPEGDGVGGPRGAQVHAASGTNQFLPNPDDPNGGGPRSNITAQSHVAGVGSVAPVASRLNASHVSEAASTAKS